MANRATDWLKQAGRDLEHAQASQSLASFEWACFAAHQAAENAVKALHLRQGQEAWGHVIARLLSDLPDSLEVPARLEQKARVRDNFDIPTSYPTSHAEGAPFEHYGPLQSEEAIRYAGEILDFVRAQMARS